VLIARLTGQEDVSVGCPMTDRDRREVEGLVGLFANTVVLRTDLSGDPTFGALLGRVRGTVLGAFAHRDLPFEALVEALNPARAPGGPPLFRLMFGYQDASGPMPDLPGLEVETFPVEIGAAKYDLTFLATAHGAGLSGALEYRTDLFDP